MVYINLLPGTPDMVNNIVLVSQNKPEKKEKGGYLPSQQEVDRARNADGAVVSFL